jgi:RNA-directed DNA polymerase
MAWQFQVKSTFRDLDKWLRRRVRACYLKQWPKSKTRLKRLIKLGVSKRDARGTAMSGKGPWRLSRTLPVQRGLSIEFLTEQGLFNLEEYWFSLHQ